MKSIFDTPISCYRNVKDNVGTVTTLRDFLFCDQYMERIKNIRTLADEARQKSLKTELPQATISGTFAPTRKAENLVTHSRLLCVDIDKQDNNDTGWLDDLKYEWCHIPQILYAARSVRGEGWFVIFRIDQPEKHKEHFEALRRDFAHEGIVIDRACKDVCRMRTISFDPEPYVNERAIVYNKVHAEPKPICRVPYSVNDELERIERCCRDIANRGVDITATYDNWFYVGAALASLGERGRSLFHLVSSQSTKYKPAETDKKFNNLLCKVTHISIGTFFHICSQYGINYKKESI